jgi:hypothetical protein
MYKFKWGLVVRLTAMVLVFGDQGPYVSRMHVCRRWYHNLNSGIVSGFRVRFGNSVAGGHCGTVLAAFGEAVRGELVVGSVECAIDSTVKCALNDALSLFLFLLVAVDFVDTLGTDCL